MSVTFVFTDVHQGDEVFSDPREEANALRHRVGSWDLLVVFTRRKISGDFTGTMCPKMWFPTDEIFRGKRWVELWNM